MEMKNKRLIKILKTCYKHILYIFSSLYQTLKSFIWFYFSIIITQNALFVYFDKYKEVLVVNTIPFHFYEVISFFEFLEDYSFKVIIWLLLLYYLYNKYHMIRYE